MLLFVPACEYTPPASPFRYPGVSVDGMITFNGQSIDRGWITFMPIRGTVGDHVVTRIHPGGTFHADRVPIGLLQVRIKLADEINASLIGKHPQFRWLPARLELVKGTASTIRLTTEAERPARFEFDFLQSPVPEVGA